MLVCLLPGTGWKWKGNVENTAHDVYYIASPRVALSLEKRSSGLSAVMNSCAVELSAVRNPCFLI